jgi:Rieske Fe-S protein
MPTHDPEQPTTFPDGRSADEQPVWRENFPIDWPQDDYVARRDFTKFLVLTSFAFTVGQAWIAIRNATRPRSHSRREICRVEQVAVGGTFSFDYPEKHDNCLLIRTGESEWVAYSQKCTHLSCPVKPRPEEGTMHCPCHEGTFDMATGRPIAGPPRRPLPIVQIEVNDGRVFATGITERTV